MAKLTKQNIEQLANEVMAWLIRNDLDMDVCIYYNNQKMQHKYHFDKDYNIVDDGIITEKDVDPHQITQWAAHNHILTMTFEGGLYSLLNYRGGKLETEFENLFNKYGLYYELGEAWNLTCYPIDDELEIEYTIYEKPQPTTHLYRHEVSNNPPELQKIMDIWYDLSSKVGDEGSCVLGAGFKFKWQGKKYFMLACSPYQGSISWEKHKDTVKVLLEDIGAENIQYDWGRMD